MPAPEHFAALVAAELEKAPGFAQAARAAGGTVTDFTPAQLAALGQGTGAGTTAALDRTTGSFAPFPFGPGMPALPAPIGPPRDDGRPEVRRFEFPVSWNLPGAGAPTLPWRTLRDSADMVDLIRRCIEVRKSEMTRLKWDIGVHDRALELAGDTPTMTTPDPTDNLAKKAKAKADLVTKLRPEIDRCRRFWESPDRLGNMSFAEWLGGALEEYFVLDALTVYPHSDRGGGLHSLEVIDGSTIKPLLDGRGATPQPPAPAYQQVLYGFPRGEWTAAPPDASTGEYSADELIYRPRHRRAFSPYGRSPVENSLVSADLWLKRQEWVRGEYQDSSIPTMFIRVPETVTWTPEQLRQYEAITNEMLTGQTAERLKLRFLAPGLVPEQLNRFTDQYKPDYDFFLVKLVCMAPGTPVLTKRGLVAIEAVEVGDEVLTHRGRWRPVRAVKKNRPTAPTRRVHGAGFDPVVVTGNHPFYVANEVRGVCGTASLGLGWKQADALRVHAPKARGAYDALTLPVMQFEPAVPNLDVAALLGGPVVDGRVHRPHPRNPARRHSMCRGLPVTVPMSAALGRIVGWYLAEGHAGSGVAAFSLGEHEKTEALGLADDLRNVFGIEPSVRARGPVLQVQACSSLLVSLLRCGLAATKVIPAWAWSGGRDFMAGMLEGWSLGDGSTSGRVTQVATRSRSLAWQMRLVAIGLGHKASVVETPARDGGTIRGRPIITRGPLYKVCWRRNSVGASQYRLGPEVLSAPVRANGPDDYAGAVYNLEVEEDESFVTTGGTVHNCMHFDVMPTELGFVPSRGLGGKGHSEGEEASEYRKGILPMAEWLEDLLSDISHRYLGMPDELRFKFSGLESADEHLQATIDQIRINTGVTTIDEVRAKLGQPLFGTKIANTPLMVAPVVTPLTDRLFDEPAVPVPFGRPPPPAGGAPGPGRNGGAVPPGPGAATPPPRPAVTADQRKELKRFVSFAEKRAGTGQWRDFEFATLPDEVGQALNAAGLWGDIEAIRKIYKDTGPSAGDDGDHVRTAAHLLDSVLFNLAHAKSHVDESVDHAQKLSEHMTGHPALASAIDELEASK